jgi:4-hydroxybenzoate polyprenyltransferase
VAGFVVACCAALVVAAWRLNPLTLALAPVALVVLLGYSFTKRLTWASHLVLGLALAGAPLGAWIAVEGQVAGTPFLLAGAVVLWVAGFDVLYALFDLEHDRAHGLHSVPARFGVPAAFAVSRACHVATVVFLVLAGLTIGVGVLYWLGVAVVAGLLLYEHSLVSPRDTSRLDMAFFTLNGVISVTFFLFVLADVIV